MEQRYFICRHCGNIVAMVKSSGVPVVCCGEPMQELLPGTVDASHEKHVPVLAVDGDRVSVRVGAAEHPMLPEHYIQWISVFTASGEQRRELRPGDKPEACFRLCPGEKIEAVYAYCNIHGLWKA